MSTETLYCWIDLELIHPGSPAFNLHGLVKGAIAPHGSDSQPEWIERRTSPVFRHREQADVWLNIWDQMVPDTAGGWKLKEIQVPDEAAPILSARLPERYEKAIWDYEYNQDWLEQEAYEAWLADQHSGVAGRED